MEEAEKNIEKSKIKEKLMDMIETLEQSIEMNLLSRGRLHKLNSDLEILIEKCKKSNTND